MANAKDDIRVACGFPSHPKTLALISTAGESAAFRLVALWCWVGANRPDGVLRKAEEVEIVAGWRGKRGRFHAALVEHGWLEADGVTLHDWIHEQPWAANKATRSAAAKAAADARWEEQRRLAGGVRPAMPDACGTQCAPDAERNADRNAPSPSPSPTPYPNPKNPLPPKGGGTEVPLPLLAQAWNRIAGGAGLPRVTTLSAARVRHVKARMVDEPDLAVWERAFAAIAADPFCAGRNDRGWRATFDYALRPEKCGRWLDLARSGTATSTSSGPTDPAEVEALDAARLLVQTSPAELYRRQQADREISPRSGRSASGDSGHVTPHSDRSTGALGTRNGLSEMTKERKPRGSALLGDESGVNPPGVSG